MQKDFSWSEILTDSSKALVEQGARLCENNPEFYRSLLDLALAQQGVKSQRASRIVCKSIIRRPDLFGSYLDEILNSIENIEDESIKFNFLNIFTLCDLPEDEDKLGLLTKICFDAVEANVQRIAIKVYAIEILKRISKHYPEMKSELIYLMEIYKMDASPAFVCRAEKIISELKKENKGRNFLEEYM